MEKTIAVIKGDGIGPDVVNEALKVLDAVAVKFNHRFIYKEVIAGGKAIDLFDNPLPDDQLEICKNSDSVLLGAVGGPAWDNVEYSKRPEKALLGLRGGLKAFANLRPSVMYNQLKEACPLKDSVVKDGVNILIVRELTGGIYFGERGESEDGKTYWDTEKYSWDEIERIVRVGFEAAMKRRKKLCLVDKANIMWSSRLWRKVLASIKDEYPEVEVSYLYIDNASMQLVKNPGQFDVIVTSNMFGDILSDEAAQIAGSIGMLASASIGNKPGPGIYEPIHGSAPDIAGKNIANPLATILSAAMLLRYDFNLEKEASVIEQAVNSVLDDGYRCADIAGSCNKNMILSTTEMGTKVREKIERM
ncbi:MAG: 3-isopropylmalate dehydrogenase [Treponema sp.]|nr:3-isopropylmalate dehydrogenase [Treponema sp.]